MTPCLATLTLLTWPIATQPGGLEPSGGLGQWEHGVPAGATDAVWATRLDQVTLHDSVEHLDIPLPPVVDGERPVVVLRHRYAFGPGDSGTLHLDTGDGFLPVVPIGGYPAAAGFVGHSGGAVETGVELPPLPDGGTLRLTFQADGVGADDGWTLQAASLVDGDPIPPRLSIVQAPSDTQQIAEPYAVTVAIDEDVQVTQATLTWDDGVGSGQVPLTPLGDDLYLAAIPPRPPDTVVGWSVAAADCDQQVQIHGPPFRVFLAAPTGLAGPTAPHTVATDASLTWQPPDSPWPVQEYVVDDLVAQRSFTATTPGRPVPLLPERPQRFQVTARYDTPLGVLLGDPSAPLELQAEVPQLLGIAPAGAYPGDRVYVELRGRSLYLLDGVSTVGFPGDARASVDQLVIRDVDRATARVTLAAGASPGPMALSVSGTRGAFRFDDAFDVFDGADAPRVLSVVPDRLVQGQAARVTIRASRAFGDSVTVSTGDELIVGTSPQVDGDTVEVELVALGSARTGDQTIVLDDGRRLWTATVKIDPYVYQGRGCASVSSRSPLAIALGFLAVLFGLRRRPV